MMQGRQVLVTMSDLELCIKVLIPLAHQPRQFHEGRHHLMTYRDLARDFRISIKGRFRSSQSPRLSYRMHHPMARLVKGNRDLPVTEGLQQWLCQVCNATHLHIRELTKSQMWDGRRAIPNANFLRTSDTVEQLAEEVPYLPLIHRPMRSASQHQISDFQQIDRAHKLNDFTRLRPRLCQEYNIVETHLSQVGRPSQGRV